MKYYLSFMSYVLGAAAVFCLVSEGDRIGFYGMMIVAFISAFASLILDKIDEVALELEGMEK